jgi:hypothetical protein
VKRIGLVILLLALQNSLMSAARTTAQSNRLVLAFYYTWYSSDLWSSGKTSDIAAQAYNSTDPAAITRHVDQARGAGIDGFVASWYGPDGGANNQTQSNFLQLLDIAAARGFSAAVDFETHSPFFNDAGAVVNALRYAINTLGAHPAYMRYGGKPVIFFWANNRFTPDEWANIRAQADPNRSAIWIAEGVTTQWLSVFDGLHLYNVAWSTDFAATAARFGKASRDLGKLWVGTAMPGWDDTRVPGRTGAYAKDRAGGQFYRNSFNGAASSNPDMLIITSFNEWMEGSQIEPSTSYGNLYLDLTRELSAAYKQSAGEQGGEGAEVQASSTVTTVAVTESPMATVTPEPTFTATPELYDTPVAYVVAQVSPTVTPTAQPSSTPAPQATPTLILATLAIEQTTTETDTPTSLVVAVGGVVLLVAGVMGLGVWRRRAG